MGKPFYVLTFDLWNLQERCGGGYLRRNGRFHRPGLHRYHGSTKSGKLDFKLTWLRFIKLFIIVIKNQQGTMIYIFFN